MIDRMQPLRRRTKLDKRGRAFFVALRDLTGFSSEKIIAKFGRHYGPEVSKATLDSLFRETGRSRRLVAADRFIAPRDFGMLRIHAFVVRLTDRTWLEVALAFEPWSEALFVRVYERFGDPEALEVFITTSLRRFPIEYARQITKVELLHLKPVTSAKISWVSVRKELDNSYEHEVDLPKELYNRHSVHYSPSRIGHVLPNYLADHRHLFTWFLIRYVNDYNCLGAEERGREIRALRHLPTGLTFSADGRTVSNVAAVHEASKGQPPALKLSIAMSELRKGNRQKYPLTAISRRLKIDLPAPPDPAKGMMVRVTLPPDEEQA